MDSLIEPTTTSNQELSSLVALNPSKDDRKNGSEGGNDSGSNNSGDGETGVGVRPSDGSPSRGKMKAIAVGFVILSALGVIVFKGLGSALVYFKTADQAVADRAQLGGQTFRIFGTVVPGTLVEHGVTESFDIKNNGVSVPVVNKGIPPQLFGPNVPVVLDGHFSGDTYVSDQILVKHSNVYVAAHPERFKGIPKNTR